MNCRGIAVTQVNLSRICIDGLFSFTIQTVEQNESLADGGSVIMCVYFFYLLMLLMIFNCTAESMTRAVETISAVVLIQLFVLL